MKRYLVLTALCWSISSFAGSSFLPDQSLDVNTIDLKDPKSYRAFLFQEKTLFRESQKKTSAEVTGKINKLKEQYKEKLRSLEENVVQNANHCQSMASYSWVKKIAESPFLDADLFKELVYLKQLEKIHYLGDENEKMGQPFSAFPYGNWMVTHPGKDGKGYTRRCKTYELDFLHEIGTWNLNRDPDLKMAYLEFYLQNMKGDIWSFPPIPLDENTVDLIAHWINEDHVFEAAKSDAFIRDGILGSSIFYDSHKKVTGKKARYELIRKIVQQNPFASLEVLKKFRSELLDLKKADIFHPGAWKLSRYLNHVIHWTETHQAKKDSSPNQNAPEVSWSFEKFIETIANENVPITSLMSFVKNYHFTDDQLSQLLSKMKNGVFAPTFQSRIRDSLLENQSLSAGQIQRLIEAFYAWSQVNEDLFEMLGKIMELPNINEEHLRRIFNLGQEYLDKKRNYEQQANGDRTYHGEMEWFMNLGLRAYQMGGTAAALAHEIDLDALFKDLWIPSN